MIFNVKYGCKYRPLENIDPQKNLNYILDTSGLNVFQPNVLAVTVVGPWHHTLVLDDSCPDVPEASDSAFFYQLMLIP